jgi:hypothetical protein
MQGYVDHIERSKLKEADVVPFQKKTFCDADLYQGLKAITVNVQESLNLPKPELFSFNRNPVNYSKFICIFEVNIESRVIDNMLKLSYLIQFCQSDAKPCIEDCVVLPPYEGFERAKSILRSRYGKPHFIESGLLTWKNVRLICHR